MSWTVYSDANVPFPPVPQQIINTPAHALTHLVGCHCDKLEHVLDGNGAQTDNIFQVTGVVQVHLLTFHINSVVDSTTFSGVKFELYDSTAATDITGTVDGSGCVGGAFFYKKGLLATALRFLNPTVGLVEEAAANKISFEPFFAIQKAGANTYIRLAFTGDANTGITADFEAHWTPMTHDANLVAV